MLQVFFGGTSQRFLCAFAVYELCSRLLNSFPHIAARRSVEFDDKQSERRCPHGY